MPGKGNITRKFSSWQIKADISPEDPIGNHISSLMALIEPRAEIFKNLVNKYKGEFTVVSYIHKTEGYNPGVYLDKEAIKKIADIGLSIDIDIYFLPKESTN